MDEQVTGAAPPDWPRVSVVVPARNEARNLPHVLGGLPPGIFEVILVDGHSVDGTIGVAQRCRPGVRIVEQTRKGKGNALACGFAQVTGDIVIMLDADGSADPGEISKFVSALVGGADFAKGTRFAHGGRSHDITLVRRWGNSLLNRLVNSLFTTRYTDLCYGYNAFWTYMVPFFGLPETEIEGLGHSDMIWGDGFEIETLMNVRVACDDVRIVEVGSVEKVRLFGDSNLRAVSDGLRVLGTILAERRRKKAQNQVVGEGRRGTSGPGVCDLRTMDLTRSLPSPDPRAG
jgi:glycosyltransferase involved in cell wall biosynthesis